MSIKYTTLNDVKISDRGISISEVNSSIAKMIENDNSMRVNGSNAPTVWECRWYNDRANASAYGYNIGDAIWLNTESLDEFVKTHEGDIVNYIIKNTKLKFAYSQVSSVYSEKTAMLKDIVTGHNYEKFGPLYWLGDINDKVQVRISLIDNNTTLPDNDQYWKDFFIDMNEDDIALSIDNQFDDQLSTQITDHIINYHLSGLEIDESELFSRYLAKDMSNVKDTQVFSKSHHYATDMVGFDNIKLFKRITTVSGHSCKWFRLWSSGLLEHGGFIDKTDLFSTDRLVYDNTQLCIDLDWTYDNDIHSPVFDYNVASLDGFYEITPICMITPSTSFILDETLHLPLDYRYVCNVSQPADMPYSSMNMSNIMPYYNTQTIDTLKNNSICIKLDTNGKMCSYYIKGYTYKNRRKY